MICLYVCGVPCRCCRWCWCYSYGVIASPPVSRTGIISVRTTSPAFFFLFLFRGLYKLWHDVLREAKHAMKGLGRHERSMFSRDTLMEARQSQSFRDPCCSHDNPSPYSKGVRRIDATGARYAGHGWGVLCGARATGSHAPEKILH
ncbi:unnamed protein product [Laminaria digitata]